MANTIPYKMINIMSPDPIQDGGIMIQNNFKTIADILDIQNTNLELLNSGLTNIISGSYVDFDATNLTSITPDYAYKTFNIINYGLTFSLNLPINMNPGNNMVITVINNSKSLNISLNSGYLCNNSKSISTTSSIIFKIKAVTNNFICEYSLIN